MNNPTIPEIRIESLEISKETKPEPCQEKAPQKKTREHALPISVIATALVLITVSLALHTSLFAMAATRLRTVSPTELLMQLILPEYVAQPIAKDDAPDENAESDKTPEETQAPAQKETEESTPAEENTSSAGNSVRDKDLSTNAENGFSLSNQTKYTPDLWALYGAQRCTKTADELAAEYGADAPMVLIYHTHGTESYGNGTTVTAETGFRSQDPEETVVAVGSVMEEVLTSAGIPVLHLEEMFDMEDWSSAYDNSSAAVRAALEEYPSIQYIFDVHRDALTGEDGAYLSGVTEIDGTRFAQLMLVCGTDEGGSGHTAWRDNLSFALTLQAALHSKYSSLMRPINLRTASFYQDLRKGALLLEVGTSANTLAEAKRSAVLFSAALADHILGKASGIDVAQWYEAY